MIDTHTHIYMTEDFPDGESDIAISRALENGVSRMLFPGVDASSLPLIRALHEKFPHCTAYAIGLHPSEVKADWQQALKEIFLDINSPGIVAIGEIGMDFHEDTTYAQEQADAFAAQVEMAYTHSLPLIIHQREALEKTLSILSEAKDRNMLPPGMVFHCFTGTPDDVRRIRETVPEAYFGIGGVVTFKNAPLLRESLSEIGINRILLETDAPWLAPVPMRGRRNESAYLPHIAQVIADTLKIPLQDVSSITDINARTLFPLLP